MTSESAWPPEMVALAERALESIAVRNREHEARHANAGTICGDGCPVIEAWAARLADDVKDAND